ncbi:iron-containing alcohol dehydrogenase [Pseudoramibacter porci]|uniref:Iron-containing alcohol dehydrogenase n=1 Tax=Pseudoramibacter porci TaxID=2606631 RepID=A0A7X2TAB3_9FIRM|nr:iron-containing alcohol dehydrogenase [Pseudoramibacter porci]MSS19316.1 iron-containing alcohol dehydrogenase [Pseudoramibacter porci]
MNAFEFFTPTKIIFGRGSLNQIADEAQKLGKKGLVVTDKGLMATGLVDPIIDALKAKHMNLEVWTDIVPNPRDVDIERGAAYAKDHDIDYLIAIGGGSSMDTAKAIGALMTNGGACADWTEGNLKYPIAPLICVPTTCGTGSEVTHESIVNNTKTLEKDCIWGRENSVTTAIIDSTVIDHLPGAILGSTGMDALTHAVEAYVCKAANPLTDGIALSAIRLISDNIIKAVETHDPEALDAMMAASTMAGMAFGNADVASVHSISEALGGYYDIPHGVANAMFLAPVSRYSVKGAADRYADVARAMGAGSTRDSAEALAIAGIDRMAELAEKLNIPKFSDIDKVNPKDFPRLAKTAAHADETADNPVMMNETDFVDVMTAVYEGRL